MMSFYVFVPLVGAVSELGGFSFVVFDQILEVIGVLLLNFGKLVSKVGD